MNITEILKPWTDEHSAAARKEGWDLWHASISPRVTIVALTQCELPSGVATHLPSDDVAMAMVRCGTGEHHGVACQIIYDHFPAEWDLMDQAYVAWMTSLSGSQS